MNLRLYITSSKYKEITDSLKEMFANGLSEKYNLEVINVLDYPDMAEQDNVIATPTLINISVDPPRRVIVCMTNKEKILMALSIVQN
jgi:circadian clock protein KaiB